MTGAPGSLTRPLELDGIDLRVGTVIEASAGTGKTYLLEHLVLDLVATGRARLEEILVVTFTERATAELLARVRARIDEALSAPDGDGAPGATGAGAEAESGRAWRFDTAARQRLLAARGSFDAMAISTIHGFCQRILGEEPFATQRLLQQTQTDGRRLFAEVFRDRLRHRFAVSPEYTDYLNTYLALGGGATIDRLEDLLYRAFELEQASSVEAPWDTPYDEAVLDRVLAALAALPCDSARVAAAFKAMVGRKKVREKFEQAIAVARRCLAEGTRAPFLAHLDRETTFRDYLGDLDEVPEGDPTRGALAVLARALLDSAPPLEEALVQRFLPEIAQAVRGRKLDQGLFDFNDMISTLAEALDAGPSGAALAARIRSRYRIALIDEAQDTSPDQWRIFRRCFLDSGGANPLVLVGDPKQAIYGFRGADVQTFLGAAEELVARGGQRLVLSVNHRSHAEVVAACNAICASSGEAPFFTGGVRYDHPVRSARGPLDPAEERPGVTLLKLDFEAKTVPIGRVRRALRDGIVRAIVRLGTGPGSRPPDLALDLGEIFVLTRTNGESAEMAEALREAGIPNALYKPDNLFETPEAEHLRTLLAAIADPGDRVARFQAWLTPFFGISLDELARQPNPAPGHPALRRLADWHQLATERRFDRLWPAILQDSGVTRRLRLSPFSQRRLANYRQLVDVLVAESRQSSKSLDDLVAWLGSLEARRRCPAGSIAEGRGIQKAETEARAVQILTIHKAKGLEADHVFVYGALGGRRGLKGKTHVLHRDGRRVLATGLPRRASRARLIAGEVEEEDQRLMYVALTRARRHVYLPYVARLRETEDLSTKDSNEKDDEVLRRLTGAYRLVNRRLIFLADTSPDGFGRWFRIEPCPVESSPARAAEAARPGSAQRTGTDARAEAGAGPADWMARLAAWRPSPELLAPLAGGPGTGAPVDVAARRGFEITSYSRLKESMGGYELPAGLPEAEADAEAEAEEAEAAVAGPLGGLRGGIDSGLFLHGILEKVPVGPWEDYAAWRARADVRAVVAAEARRWQRTAEDVAAALPMVYSALAEPVTLGDGATLRGIGAAGRIRREVEFVFPLEPPASPRARGAQPGGHEAGFVRGVLDVLFEHQGRVHFADWKSDRLPDYGAATLAAHATRNYALQVRLYVLAVVRMLGIETAADYQGRFGGWIYLFLRGLASPVEDGGGPRGPGDATAGAWVGRPSWDEVQRWQLELPRLLEREGGRASDGSSPGRSSRASPRTMLAGP
jgi:exodeoxyribonuclease V beta subunit